MSHQFCAVVGCERVVLPGETQCSKHKNGRDKIDAKIKRLEIARLRIEQFVSNGGDLNSQGALPLGIELFEAFNEISKEFGHPILKKIDEL
jgi:hypothetical protein